MSQAITATLFDLASVRVSKYRHDTRLKEAVVRFRVQSLKTRDYKYFDVKVPVPETLVESAPGGDVVAAVTAAAWDAVYADNIERILSFVRAETAKPTVNSAFTVRSVFPPSFAVNGALGDFQAGRALTVTLLAKLAVLWTVVSGELPPAVDLNALTGELSGIPAAGGEYSFTVEVAGSSPSLTARRTFTLRVADAPVWVTTDVPDVAAGSPASFQFVATGATGFAVTAGSLPPGTALSAAGRLSGAATTTGSYTFTVTATAGALAAGTAAALSAAREFTAHVGSLPLWQTASAFEDAATGVPMSRTVSATSAVAYSLFAGALPPGLTFSSTGLLSGTPAASGAYVFTLKAQSSAASIFTTRAFSQRVETPPSWVTDTYLPAVPTGSALNATLTATLAYSFALVNGALPPGAALSNGTGVLSGTLNVSGDYAFTVRAYSPAAGVFSDRAFSLQVATRPVWVTAALTDGATGIAVSQQLQAANAVFFAVESGALPLGVVLSSGGALSGPPEAAGTYSVRIRASSVAAGVNAVRDFTLLVEDTPVFATASPLLEAQTGTAQARAFVASNTASFALASGALPPGMALSGTGAFSGTPTVPGVYVFAVRATSPAPSVSATKAYRIVVASKPAWQTVPTLTAAPVGTPLSYGLLATNTEQYTVAAGAVPAGLTLSALDGTLYGTPTAAGDYRFTVRAVSAGPSIFTDREFALLLADVPQWTSPAALDAATKDVPYALQLHASAAVTFSLQAGALPPGLSLSGTGLVTGTATTTGSWSATVRATSAAYNVYTDRAFTLAVAAKPVWLTAGALPGVATGEVFSAQLAATFAVAYAVVPDGALPAGLSLSTGGTLAGTPTAATESPSAFTVRATSNAANVWTDRAFSLHAVARPVWDTPAELPDVVRGASQSRQISAADAVSYAVLSGAPPVGCSVSPSGLLSGTAAASGSFAFVLRAATLTPDVHADRAFAQLVGTYPVWQSAADVDVQLNVRFDRQLAATEAASYAVVAGELPAGVTLSASGGLTGTPSIAGTSVATVRASSTPTLYTDRAFTFRAAFVPIWSTPAAVPDAQTGTAIVPLQLSASSAVAYSVVSGALPPGLELTPGGVLSGTPSAGGAYSFGVRAATAAASVHADQTFTLAVATAPYWATDAELADAARGEPLSVQLDASGTTQYAVVSGALPAGLTVSDQGALSGTPTAAGLATWTVRAGTTAPSVYTDRTFRLLVVTRPTWTTPAALADLNTGAAAALQLRASDAAAYQLLSGALPTGLALSAQGVASGTLAAAGSFGFTVRALGAGGDVYADRAFAVRVGDTPVWTTPPVLQDRVVGDALTVQLEATAGAAYAALGPLPTGLSLSPFGLLTGTPERGLGAFTVRAFSAASEFFADRAFALLVTSRPVWQTAPSLPDATKGVPLSIQLDADGASAFSLVSGTVPPGLTLSGTGLLAGAPTTDGPYDLTVRAVSASASVYADRAFALLIETVPAWTTPGTLPDVATGEPYEHQLVAVEVDAFSLRSGALPGGVALTPGGVLSGAPAGPGAFSFTVRAESTSTSMFVERTFNLLVATRPVFATASPLPDAQAGAPYSVRIAAADAAGGYALVGGALPDGAHDLTADGVLACAAPAAGTSRFTVRARSASDAIWADREFALRFVELPVWRTPAELVLPSPAAGVSRQFSATGAATYTLEAGVLPPGTSLSAAGLLTGSADAAGAWDFELRASGAAPAFFAVRAFSATVERTPVWSTPAALQDAATLVELPVTLTAAGAARYAVVEGALPDGVSLDPVSGDLVGASTAAGDHAWTARATTALGTLHADRAFSLRTVAVPVWTTAADLLLASGPGGLASQLNANGAVSYALESGLLPPGVELSPAGMLSGAPTAAGPWDFTVRALGAYPAFYALRDFSTDVELPPDWGPGPPAQDPLDPQDPQDPLDPQALDPLERGVPASVRLAATGGQAYEVVSGALPPGVALSTGGVLSGSPTAAGTYAFEVRATTGSGYLHADRAFELVVLERPAWVTPAAIRVLEGAASQLFADDAESYSLVSGVLPPGVTLTGAGVLTGTLTARGTYGFEARATGGAAHVYTDRAFTATAETRPDWVTDAALEPVLTGAPVSVQLSASGAAAYALVGGALPPGVTLTDAGALTGAPTAAGDFGPVVRAATPGGLTRDRAFALSAVATPAWVTPAEIVVAQGAPYQFAATHAAGYSAVRGTLPTGLTLSADGALTGALTAGGTFAFTLRATGAIAAAVADRDFTAAAELTPDWQSAPELAAVARDAPADVALTARFAASYSLVAGAAPAGLTLAADGRLSGTPTAAGPAAFTVRASSASGSAFADRAFGLLVVAVPEWSTPPTLVLPGATSVALQLVAQHAVAFEVEAGALPAGLVLSAAGVLSGAPSANGSFAFTVRAVGGTGGAPAAAFYAIRTFSATVELAPAWVTASPLPALELGVHASRPLVATDAASYERAEGAVPAGMTLLQSGLLQGAPSAAGTFAFRARALSPSGASFDDRAFEVAVVARPAWVTASSGLSPATVGSEYSAVLTATGATSYSAPDGAPPGLVLSAAGLLSGAPAEAGSYSFAVVAAASGLTATRQFDLVITFT